MLERTMQDVLKNASMLLDLQQKLLMKEEKIVKLESTIADLDNAMDEIPSMVNLYNAVKELQGDLVESPATLTYYLR